MTKKELQDQERTYRQMARDQLFQVDKKEYKRLQKAKELLEYTKTKARLMMSELETLLPHNPTRQQIAEANEIVIHHHIVEM